MPPQLVDQNGEPLSVTFANRPPRLSTSNYLDGARYAPFDTLRRPAFGSVSDAGTESGRVNPGVAEQDLNQPPCSTIRPPADAATAANASEEAHRLGKQV